MVRLLLLGVVAFTLLIFYVYALHYTVQYQQCLNSKTITNCEDLIGSKLDAPQPVDNNGGKANTPRPLGEGITTILTLVGGIISALVISTLAITNPNSSPDKALIASATPVVPGSVTSSTTTGSDMADWLTKVLTYLYLIVWFCSGIYAIKYGYLDMAKYQNPVPELTAVAKAWLGLSVASVYALFGLKPSSANE